LDVGGIHGSFKQPTLGTTPWNRIYNNRLANVECNTKQQSVCNRHHPNCHYYVTSGITVEDHVPVPSTLILIGSGLLGLAGIRRKRALVKITSSYVVTVCIYNRPRGIME
jgi:hypothetical protein